MDGYIDGTGTGLIILDGGVYKTFHGTYKRGIPASDITSKSVTRENPRSNPFIKSEDIETRNLRALDVGMSLCNLETKDPYLKNALVEFLKKTIMRMPRRWMIAIIRSRRLKGVNWMNFSVSIQILSIIVNLP